MTAFTLTRIYAGADGESHFEDIVLSEAEARSPTGVLARISDSLPVSELSFREVLEEASDVAPHVAPRRVLILHLDGEVEVEASDGEVRRFAAGVPVIVEDTSGKGHITRKIGTGSRKTLIATLPDFAELVEPPDRVRLSK